MFVDFGPASANSGFVPSSDALDYDLRSMCELHHFVPTDLPPYCASLMWQKGELGELDAEAGQGTQPLRGPAVTAGGESGADSSSRAQGRGESNTSGAAGVGAGPDSGGYHPGAATASMAAATTAMGGAPHAAGVEEEMMTMMPSTENGVYAMAAATTAVHRGSMTDVMAHELVVGCLVRLAMVSEGEIAMEVMSVLDDERGRARAREKLGLGAVGPMEEIVAKVNACPHGRGVDVDVGVLAGLGGGGGVGALFDE